MKNPITTVKNHVQKNKVTYLACGATAVVVAGTVYILTSKGLINIETVIDGDENVVTNIVQRIVQIGFRNEAAPTVINLVERSTASKPVHLVGTNLYFSSLSEAARETGHHLSMISKNVNGLIDDVKGDVFQLLEEAA